MMIQGCNMSPAQKVPVESKLCLYVYSFFIFRFAELCLYVDDSFADSSNSCSELRVNCQQSSILCRYLCLKNEKCNHAQASPVIYNSLGLERSLEKTSAQNCKALICICRYNFQGGTYVKNFANRHVIQAWSSIYLSIIRVWKAKDSGDFRLKSQPVEILRGCTLRYRKPWFLIESSSIVLILRNCGVVKNFQQLLGTYLSLFYHFVGFVDHELVSLPQSFQNITTEWCIIFQCKKSTLYCWDLSQIQNKLAFAL